MGTFLEWDDFLVLNIRTACLMVRVFVVADDIVDGVAVCSVVATETDDVFVGDVTVGPDVVADSDVVARVDVAAAVANDIDVVEDGAEICNFLAFK